jgi:hypothetical protein
MRLTCFSEIGKALEAEHASPKLCSEKQERRFLLLQCHGEQSHCSTLFASVYKRTTKGGLEVFGLWLLLWALAFTLGFGLGFCFGLFGVGSFWKGKELLKGKEWLKTG